MIYLDHNGQWQLQASPSIAGCEGAIFTQDVTDRFIEMTGQTPQTSPQFPNPTQAPHSPWDEQPASGWAPPQARQAEMIPFQWSSQQSRKKSRRAGGTPKSRPKSTSPPPAAPAPGRTVLRVGNRALLRRYYEKAFEDFQQLNCRAIAKSYIKLVEPRKQVHYPYNGRRVIAGVSQRVDPEFTKPAWWPAGVLHKEPDHLLKPDRLRLLVHILCELKDSHGVTTDKLREAGQDVRRQITPAHRLQVLDEIYFVRQMEEQYLDGEIDGSTLIQITQTHLPEAIFPDDDLLSRAHAAPVTAPSIEAEYNMHDARDNPVISTLEDDDPKLHHSHSLPLSPTTSESSGPHSPTGSFGYPIAIAPSVHVIPPLESPNVTKSIHPDPGYLSGYYSQPFVSDKGPGFWPHANTASHRPYPNTRDGPTILCFQQQFLMESTGSRRKSDTMSAEPPVSTPVVEDVSSDDSDNDESDTPAITPGTLSRNGSFSNSSSYLEDWESFPPLDKLTIFDLLDNIHLSQRLETWQQTLAAQKEKVRKQREKLRLSSLNAKDRVMGEWKRHAPTAEEKLEKYRARMKHGVERLGKRWSQTATVTLREKMSFIAGVLNIFISGYLIGACPEYFYYWFSGQLAFFMPIRYFTYHAKGYHYFLADLCYFVNLLCMLSIWVFPNSKRLFISTFCLTFGNNAVAIAMWRNSMVFHSMDKVVSLFIHIMPPVTLHCIVHLTPVAILKERFPAVYDIKFSKPGDPEHYGLGAMILWSTAPYVVWQLMYHFLITVRRRDQIAAGRPTSFTWLRKSYSKAWIGRFVLSLPETLQEPCFMVIQYAYALSTMLPCPIWFWYKWASGLFMSALFVWSIHNGATYYIDVFGRRFQKELEQLRTDMARWQNSPEGSTSPILIPEPSPLSEAINAHSEEKRSSVDRIPLLDTADVSSTDILEKDNKDSVVRERV
ncbi:uncharacterized protein N7518_003341 [Penicillium psychrosexuale]|uniref:uncharacterized protein n=1 Tax=Penicillium psychrosexuale TaxID=1002107 RepID=UPI002545AAD8|nr:uncharacterized protein N7518_003341 [Penicillium psychrosexuale]KAJ5801273.1 hypothetical protein N7518_003341 [Penicillium psychrosexuale]